MGNIKEINIKNRTYYFFNDIINIKNFDSRLLEIDKMSYKNIGIYNNYIRIKKIAICEDINSVNPLYLMTGEVIRHIDEKNRNKYLVFDSSDENKEVLRKYNKLWDETENKIGEWKYGKDFVKIKFDSNDNLPLNKPLNLHMLTIIVKSAFEDEGKFYPHVYLDECFYQLGVQETLLASNIKMLEYDRIDISEVIDVNKTSASKECDIFHY